MKYYLIKLSGKEDQEKGFPWAVYEYNKSFSEKIRESPYILQNVLCKNGCDTHKLGNAYFMATTGNLEILDNVGRIF